MRVMYSSRILSDFDDVQVFSFDIHGDVERNMSLYKRIKPDVVLHIDNGATSINSRDFLNRIDCPKAYYNFDAFCDMGRMYQGYITYFDYVFNIDSWLVPSLKPKKKGFFLPTCLINATSFPRHEKIYDVIFFGSTEPKVYGDSRMPYIEALRTAFGDRFYFSDHLGYNLHSVNEYANKMSESKVAVNLGFSNHLSLRPFEAMAARCSVVSTPLTDIENVEGMKERIIIVNTPSQMVEAVKNILSGNAPEQVLDIEDNEKWCLQNHTLTARIKVLLKAVQDEEASVKEV